MQSLITVYLLDILGTYVGTMEVDAMGRMPEHFTLDAPPALEAGQVAIWNGAAWRVDDKAPVELGANLELMKEAKNGEIDSMRATANASAFPFRGKLISCDALSRSDIDGVANHIALCGAFPEDFPGAWKVTDKTMLPLPDIDDFRAMYAAMTKQGARNFSRSQELKAQLEAATTPEEIAAIVW